MNSPDCLILKSLFLSHIRLFSCDVWCIVLLWMLARFGKERRGEALDDRENRKTDKVDS
jgi:hypothetical protein